MPFFFGEVVITKKSLLNDCGFPTVAPLFCSQIMNGRSYWLQLIWKPHIWLLELSLLVRPSLSCHEVLCAYATSRFTVWVRNSSYYTVVKFGDSILCLLKRNCKDLVIPELFLWRIVSVLSCALWIMPKTQRPRGGDGFFFCTLAVILEETFCFLGNPVNMRFISLSRQRLITVKQSEEILKGEDMKSGR